MDREELMERICPTDAIHECGIGDCESNCKDCGVLLNALLDEYDNQIREDAIDECIEALGYDMWDVAKLEKLKGKNNG